MNRAKYHRLERLAESFQPKETLEEKLQEMGMSVREFAIRTNKPENTIHKILAGNSSVTPEMAVAFEKVTKIPARVWNNLQRSYNEYRAREEARAKQLEKKLGHSVVTKDKESDQLLT